MIKLSILILLQHNLFLNAIRLKKCVTKLLTNVFLYFFIRYVPDQYKTQQMCDKAVDDCLAALKFVPDWFVTSKMVKILLRR